MSGKEVRDLLWTIPKDERRPPTRSIMDWSDVDTRGPERIIRDKLSVRDVMQTRDITVSQFRMDQPSQRSTNPLTPTYIYDGGQVEHVEGRVPKYGRRYTRSPDQNFSLMSKDINGENVHQAEYPKHLIKTRQTNRTDDILGAQANTIGFGPKIWTQPGRDPAKAPEKITNRVWDIDGTAPGTGGCLAFAAPRIYRTQKQTQLATSSSAAHSKSAERQADIDAVRALS